MRLVLAAVVLLQAMSTRYARLLAICSVDTSVSMPTLAAAAAAVAVVVVAAAAAAAAAAAGAAAAAAVVAADAVTGADDGVAGVAVVSAVAAVVNVVTVVVVTVGAAVAGVANPKTLNPKPQTCLRRLAQVGFDSWSFSPRTGGLGNGDSVCLPFTRIGIGWQRVSQFIPMDDSVLLHDVPTR